MACEEQREFKRTPAGQQNKKLKQNGRLEEVSNSHWHRFRFPPCPIFDAHLSLPLLFRCIFHLFFTEGLKFIRGDGTISSSGFATHLARFSSNYSIPGCLWGWKLQVLFWFWLFTFALQTFIFFGVCVFDIFMISSLFQDLFYELSNLHLKACVAIMVLKMVKLK